MEKITFPPTDEITGDADVLHFLQPAQVALIDCALTQVGDFGEVRLVVEKGRLRFMVLQRSLDFLKLQSG